MDPIDAVTLFWARAGDGRGGPVCIATPAVDCPREPAKVRVEVAGALKAPTGRLVACDPFGAMFPQDVPPFTQRFAPGIWQVEVYVAVEPGAELRGIHLAAAVRVERTAIARWEYAVPVQFGLRLAASVDVAGDGVVPRFVPIDGGLAAFVDKAGLHALGEEAERWLRAKVCDGPLATPLTKTRTLELGGEPDTNAVIFGAGVGDGAYPCFVGRSSSGVPVALLILFDTFDAERTAASMASESGSSHGR